MKPQRRVIAIMFILCLSILYYNAYYVVNTLLDEYSVNTDTRNNVMSHSSNGVAISYQTSKSPNRVVLRTNGINKHGVSRHPPNVTITSPEDEEYFHTTWVIVEWEVYDNESVASQRIDLFEYRTNKTYTYYPVPNARSYGFTNLACP